MRPTDVVLLVEVSAQHCKEHRASTTTAASFGGDVLGNGYSATRYENMRLCSVVNTRVQLVPKEHINCASFSIDDCVGVQTERAEG